MTVMIGLALRLGRWGIVGYAGVALLSALVQGIGFYQIAGHTAAERERFGQSMSALATQFTVILPAPMRPDTVGGYVQWRAFGFLGILFAIWALVSAAGAARGDEERGITESILAAGASRSLAVTAHVIAFAIGSLAAALAASAAFVISVATGGESVNVARAVEAAIPVAALAICCYALTLLIAQLTSARSAIPVAGGILLGLFLLNSLSRTFDGLVSWRWLSPFHYSELSQPLPPGGSFDVPATFVLIGVAIVASGLAQIAFAYRDVGSPLLRLPARSEPASYELDAAAAWGIPIIRDLYERRVTLLVWAAGLSATGALFTVLTKTIVQPLLAIPELKPYFDVFLHGAIYPAFLGFIWFGFAQLLMAGFAISQVARWSAEDSDGRLELVLSNPISRGRVVAERAIVLTLGALLITAVSGVAVGVESHYQGIDLDPYRLTIATLLLVPFTLVFAAVGAVMAARIPRATAGLLGIFAFASYLFVQLGPIFKLPAWTQNLSAFTLYGQPLTQGVDQTGLLIMVAIVAVGFAGSALMMQRRDVGA